MAFFGQHWRTFSAAYPIEFPFHDIDKLEYLSQGFFDHSGGIVDGCVSAMVGFGVATHQPNKWEVKYPKITDFVKDALLFLY